MSLNNRYFICENSIIWTVFPSGETNFFGDIQINDDDTVFSLGERGGDQNSEVREILGTYTLWPSLLSLAKRIEGG